MKINKNRRLELCASTDDTRSHMKNPWVDVEGKRILATDGMRIAVCSVEVDPKDVSGFITPRSLKEARENQPLNDHDLTIRSKKKTLDVYGTIFIRPQNYHPYPKVDIILNEIAERKNDVSIAVNAQFLSDAAQAIGATSIIISFDPNDKKTAIKITSVEDPHGDYCLIMPILFTKHC